MIARTWVGKHCDYKRVQIFQYQTHREYSDHRRYSTACTLDPGGKGLHGQEKQIFGFMRDAKTQEKPRILARKMTKSLLDCLVRHQHGFACRFIYP